MKTDSDTEKEEHPMRELIAERLPVSLEIKKRQRAMQVANAINAIEGTPPSEYADELAKRWANGELTGEQMKQLLSEYHHKIAAQAKEQNEN